MPKASYTITQPEFANLAAIKEHVFNVREKFKLKPKVFDHVTRIGLMETSAGLQFQFDQSEGDAVLIFFIHVKESTQDGIVSEIRSELVDRKTQQCIPRQRPILNEEERKKQQEEHKAMFAGAES